MASATLLKSYMMNGASKKHQHRKINTEHSLGIPSDRRTALQLVHSQKSPTIPANISTEDGDPLTIRPCDPPESTFIHQGNGAKTSIGNNGGDGDASTNDTDKQKSSTEADREDCKRSVGPECFSYRGSSVFTKRTQGDKIHKVPLKQRTIRIERKPVASVPSWNASRGPNDWYLYTLKLLRQANLSKSLFEIYCLASRREGKSPNVPPKAARLGTLTSKDFVPDTLLKVEGKHCDNTDMGHQMHSEDINERLRKFARTNWKTPGEIAILLGKEQNKKRERPAADSLEQGGINLECLNDLQDTWQDNVASVHTHKHFVPTPRPSPCPGGRIQTMSLLNMALSRAIQRETPDRDSDSFLRIQTFDPDQNRANISLKVKSKSTDIESLETDPQIKLPKLRFTTRNSAVAPNGHPRKKTNKPFDLRMSVFPDPQALPQSPMATYRSDRCDSLDSLDSLDPITSVYQANRPPPTPPCSPSSSHRDSPSTSPILATRHVKSHVVKLPDINDGKSNSAAESIPDCDIFSDKDLSMSTAGHRDVGFVRPALETTESACGDI